MMACERDYYVYIMSNKANSVIYTGCTSDLVGRILQHKEKFYPRSFTVKYQINKLVYFEELADPWLMIHREKQLKNLVRRKKIQLIEKNNPNWKDLTNDWDY